MILHPEQDDTVEAAYSADGLIIVASMGAGKTLTTLALLVELIADGVIDNAIIWGPLRVAQTVWDAEIAKWGFDLTVGVLAGKTAKQRQAVLDSNPQILVVNYEAAPWLKAAGYRATARTAVIYDEITRLKNPQGARRKAVVVICKGAVIRYGLTGTVRANGPLDFWGMADAVRPAAWGRSFYKWRAANFWSPSEHIWKPHDETALDAALAGLCYQMKAPVYSEPVMLFDDVIMPPAAMGQYQAFERDMIAEIGGQDIAAFHAATVSIKCRQIASGMVLDEDRETVWVHSAKLDALREIITDAGEPTLVFYQYRAEVDAMRAIWPDLAVLGGGTSNKQARENIEAWNRGEVPVMALHPASAGHGIQLQHGGRRAVWLSLTWSQEEYAQANARIARQGQTQTVYIHHINAKGTIDGRVATALANKRTAQDALMEMI